MDLWEEDFYESFNEAIDLGLEENVDFFVHTGDLFDTWAPSNRAMNEFKKAMIKLYKKNKTMYLIMGDHVSNKSPVWTRKSSSGQQKWRRYICVHWKENLE